MIIFTVVLITVLAWKMDLGMGPDELSRYRIAEWISSHHALPTGFEDELIDPVWCFSYAFTPYLPSMIAGLFMKIAMLFTSSLKVIVFAARLVNVISAAATMFVSFRVADKILDKKSSVYFFVAVTAFLPQFVFLSSYLNNDAMTILAAFMILDAVLDGASDNWSMKSMVYLSFGIGICALTYYFGYGWIFFAIAGFFYTAMRQEKDRKKIFRKAGLIVLFVFVIAGWYFIRNMVIYKGDMLGYRAQQQCVAEYSSAHDLIPANNPGKKSMNVRDMLNNGRWMQTTKESFIGVFGGMTICLDGSFYDLYELAFWFCVLLFALYRHRTVKKINTYFLFAMYFELAFPIVFSIYNSYMRDYQPQGRYVISILPVICILVSVGVDEWSKSVENKYALSKPFASKLGKALPVLGTAALLGVFLVIYITVILPTMTYITLPGAGSVEFYYVR